MYYALGLALCLAVMFLVMSCAMMACAACLRVLDLRRVSLSARAGILFLIRAVPAALAATMAVGFALPAFLRFEPRSSGEFVGFRLLMLAVPGAVVLSTMAMRAARLLYATSRLNRQWSAKAQTLSVPGVQLPVYCVDDSESLMAVIGIFRPRIFVARRFAETLTAEELSAAVAHEIAHVRAFDNLRQLFLKITRAPRWMSSFRMTDAAWTNASEVAADETALSHGASALDLSSALIKAGRLGSRTALCEAVAASHLLPAVNQSSFELRVAHLRELLEQDNGRDAVRIQSHPAIQYGPGLVCLSLLLAYAVSFNAMLPWIHECLEVLAR